MKPNIGHGEGASGLSSLIKAVLSLENETIPPQVNFSNPNPRSKDMHKMMAYFNNANDLYSQMGQIQFESSNGANVMAKGPLTACIGKLLRRGRRQCSCKSYAFIFFMCIN